MRYPVISKFLQLLLFLIINSFRDRDGLPVGRLPEFSFRGSVFDLLGGGFLGRTDGGPLGGDGWTLLEGTIDA